MPNPDVIWKTSRPDDFYKQVGVLPRHIKKKLSIVMKKLVRSQDPGKFGEWKPHLKFGGAFVADLTDGYRLSYQVDFENRVITIIQAGTHKMVQGK
jgi:mRNA-degrading endonuclease RelE of RelBE toxin-antitoxin system